MEKQFEMLVNGEFNYITSVWAEDEEEARLKAMEGFRYDAGVLSDQSEPNYFIEFEAKNVEEN